jgi:hypothetical protein
MKKLILITASILAFTLGYSQTVRKDASGNYVAVVSVRDSTSAKNTGQTYTDAKGNVFPVMISKAGKLFVVRISTKTGAKYNQYLKVN